MPETKLPPIPLGSIPGKRELTVKKESKVTTVLCGRILPELSAPLNAPIELGTIAVPVPESNWTFQASVRWTRK